MEQRFSSDWNLATEVTNLNIPSKRLSTFLVFPADQNENMAQAAAFYAWLVYGSSWNIISSYYWQFISVAVHLDWTFFFFSELRGPINEAQPALENCIIFVNFVICILSHSLLDSLSQQLASEIDNKRVITWTAAKNSNRSLKIRR